MGATARGENDGCVLKQILRNGHSKSSEAHYRVAVVAAQIDSAAWHLQSLYKHI